MVSTADSDSIALHPKGTRARALLSSVFGPYARDDEFGSRSINPMELYHNQVTREQGSFSLRMFHRSWGLMMIQRNISAPSTSLEAVQGREVEQRAGRGDVALDHHQAPGAMKHAEREAALRARYLVVIELHGIDGAAAEFVIARVRTENRAQEHACLSSFRMRSNQVKGLCNHDSIVGAGAQYFCDVGRISDEMTELLQGQPELGKLP